MSDTLRFVLTCPVCDHTWRVRRRAVKKSFMPCCPKCFGGKKREHAVLAGKER